MKRSKKSEDGGNLWAAGSFAQTCSQSEMKDRMRSFHMRHDEEMLYRCRTCNAAISVHNRDWHDGMCDACFDRACFSEEKEGDGAVQTDLSGF